MEELKSGGTIIVLVGAKQVGKDEVASHIFKQYRYNDQTMIVTAIAKTLKTKVCLEYGITKDQLELLKRNEKHRCFKGLSMRQLLQKIGQDVREQSGDDYWVQKTMESVKTYNNYVVSDVRYSSEYKYIKQFCNDNNMRFVSIKIKRSTNEPHDNHISEFEWQYINCQHQIYNDYSLFTLYRNVNSILELINDNDFHSRPTYSFKKAMEKMRKDNSK